MKNHPVVPNKSSWYKRARKLPVPFFFRGNEVGIESSFPPVQSTQRERKDFRMHPGGSRVSPITRQLSPGVHPRKKILQFLRNLSADFPSLPLLRGESGFADLQINTRPRHTRPKSRLHKNIRRWGKGDGAR